MKDKYNPEVGDIWYWEALPPAYFLILQKSEAGGNWWNALELTTGTITEIQFGSYWKYKFIS